MSANYRHRAGDGDRVRHTKEDDLRAHELLPARLRAALHDTVIKYSSCEMQKYLDQGVTVDQIITSIKEADAEQRKLKAIKK